MAFDRPPRFTVASAVTEGWKAGTARQASTATSDGHPAAPRPAIPGTGLAPGASSVRTNDLKFAEAGSRPAPHPSTRQAINASGSLSKTDRSPPTFASSVKEPVPVLAARHLRHRSARSEPPASGSRSRPCSGHPAPLPRLAISGARTAKPQIGHPASGLFGLRARRPTASFLVAEVQAPEGQQRLSRPPAISCGRTADSSSSGNPSADQAFSVASRIRHGLPSRNRSMRSSRASPASNTRNVKPTAAGRDRSQSDGGGGGSSARELRHARHAGRSDAVSSVDALAATHRHRCAAWLRHVQPNALPVRKPHFPQMQKTAAGLPANRSGLYPHFRTEQPIKIQRSGWVRKRHAPARAKTGQGQARAGSSQGRPAREGRYSHQNACPYAEVNLERLVVVAVLPRWLSSRMG